MKTYLVSITVMMLILIASACSPAQTPVSTSPTSVPAETFTLATSIQDIVGTWHVANTKYLRFYEDGTAHQARSQEALDDQPYAINEVSFEGTRMSLKEIAVSGVGSCGDAVGIYEVQLLSSGKIKLVRIEDSCSGRAGDITLVYDPAQ